MKKRMLSALLTIAMALTLLPTAALAADTEQRQDSGALFIDYETASLCGAEPNTKYEVTYSDGAVTHITDTDADAQGAFLIEDAWFGKEVTLKKAYGADDVTQTIAIPTRPAAPTVVPTATATSTAVTVTNLVDGQEYAMRPATYTSEPYTGWQTDVTFTHGGSGEIYKVATRTKGSRSTKTFPSEIRESEALPTPVNVKYQAFNAVNGTFITDSHDAYPVTSNSTTLGTAGADSWYVARNQGPDITFDSRITVNGNVHLILENNRTLTASRGIGVSEGNSLTIYAQRDSDTERVKMGALTADVLLPTADPVLRYNAAIGGSGMNQSSGQITIHGGKITANGGGAGIGGGYNGTGAVTIHGGVIEATAGNDGGSGAGIGGGYMGSGTIRITGGTVKATGSAQCAGIGGGYAHGSDVTITGGVVTAIATEDYFDGTGAGIGAGADWLYDESSFSVSGGAVVFASSITDGNYKTDPNTNGVVFEDGSGTVYGNAVLTGAAEVPALVPLTVPEGASLTVGAGGVLTNYGVIIATGTLTRNGGTITKKGNGIFGCAVVWRLNSVTHDKGDAVTYATSEYNTGYTATLTATQGYALPASITVKVGGVPLTDGYTYNSTTGKLTIDPDSVIGTVEIIAAGRSLSTGGDYSAYTVTVTTGEGGSVSPSGAVSVPRGQDKTFAITPEDGYVIGEVLLDGASVKNKLAGGSYTLANVQKAHTLKVTFLEKSKANPFTDVKQDDWFFDDVLFVYENALMNGTSATTFKPGKTTTRGMIAAILYRMAGSPAIEDEIWGYPFADVNAEAYYGTAVYWARLNGIVGGYDAEHFGPERPITREQLATILYRYAKYKGYDVSAAEDLSHFSDSGTVGAYAADAMRWACGADLIRGSGEKLTPKGSATRAQVAAILHRFCENIAK